MCSWDKGDLTKPCHIYLKIWSGLEVKLASHHIMTCKEIPQNKGIRIGPENSSMVRVLFVRCAKALHCRILRPKEIVYKI